MARIKKINKYNNPNYYGFGGDLKKAFSFKNNPISGASVAQGIMGAAPAVGGAIGGMIGGGLESGAGSVFSAAGDIASAIPGPWGAAASAALKVVGGITNKAFGSKLNQEKINEISKTNDNLNNTEIKAEDTSGLMDSFSNIDYGSNFSKSDVGKDGWFANKAAKKYRELKKKRNIATNRANSALAQGVENVDTNQDIMRQQNFFDMGGALDMNQMPNNINQVNEGGTHEQNPLGGVPMGIDEQGNTNLVEEGEVIWEDFVFSNRLKPSKKLQDKYKIKGLTYAEAVEKLQEESKDRPNDPISQRTLDKILEELGAEQELKKQEKQQKEAEQMQGLMESLGLNDSMNTTNPPSSSPQEAMQEMSQDLMQGDPSMMQGTPNEFASGGHLSDYNDFLDYKGDMSYSNTPFLPQYIGGPVVGNIVGDSKITSNSTPPTPKQPTDYSDFVNTLFPHTYPTPKVNNVEVNNVEVREKRKEKEVSDFKPKRTWMRYVPAIGGLIGYTNSLFDKPDYSDADSIVGDTEAPLNNLGEVEHGALGDYLDYKPFDRNYYLNKLEANSAATRRMIRENAGGNRGLMNAGLLAQDYNTINNYGNIARQSEEYNLNQRRQVADFNRGTNQYNIDGQFKADMANLNTASQKVQSRINASLQRAQLRQNIKDKYDAAKNANLSNFFNSLGNIGWENFNMNMINSNKGLKYGMNSNGTQYYKELLKEQNRAKQEEKAAKKAKKRNKKTKK